jgi:hypothetical protein
LRWVRRWPPSPQFYLVPDIQQEHIILFQIILIEVRDLCGQEAPSLVGAFKEPGANGEVFLL